MEFGRASTYVEVVNLPELERLGMIRLGSLVAIIISDREDVQVEVTPGDTVKAGISVLARYRVD